MPDCVGGEQAQWSNWVWSLLPEQHEIVKKDRCVTAKRKERRKAEGPVIWRSLG